MVIQAIYDALSGGLPLVVLTIKKEFDAWQPAGYTRTFCGNQLAIATGYVSLKIMREQNLVHLHCPTMVSSQIAEVLINAANQSMDYWDQRLVH